MIRFAVIGTNWITRQFVEAAHESGKYKLTAVYSRSLEQAQHFANDFSVEHLFTSLEAMAESDAIDAVYIASPNSLHFSQTQLFLSHKIHVICEKPLASNQAEVDAAIACARENQVVLFEAFKTAYLPNFHLLRRALPKVGKLRKVFSTIASIPRGISVTGRRESQHLQSGILQRFDYGYRLLLRRRRWHYSVNRKACRQPPVCWQAVWMPTAWW